MARNSFNRQTYSLVDIDKAMLTELATNPRALPTLQAGVALELLKEEQSRGNLRDPVYIVDRRQDRTLANVKFGGLIEFRDKLSTIEFIDYALKYLMRNSPIDRRPSKDRYVYKDSFAVLLNGKVRKDINRLKVADPKDVISIVNYQPYAKRIEFADTKGRPKKRNRFTGKTESKGWSLQKPNGVMRVALKHFRQRFGAEFFVQYTFISGTALTGAAGIGSPVKPFKSKGDLLFPMLSFISRNQGIAN